MVCMVIFERRHCHFCISNVISSVISNVLILPPTALRYPPTQTAGSEIFIACAMMYIDDNYVQYIGTIHTYMNNIIEDHGTLARNN